MHRTIIAILIIFPSLTYAGRPVVTSEESVNAAGFRTEIYRKHKNCGGGRSSLIVIKAPQAIEGSPLFQLTGGLFDENGVTFYSGPIDEKPINVNTFCVAKEFEKYFYYMAIYGTKDKNFNYFVKVFP